MSFLTKVKNWLKKVFSKVTPGGHSHPTAPTKLADKTYGDPGEQLMIGPGTSREAILTQWNGISKHSRREILAHEDFSHIPDPDKNYLINFKKPDHTMTQEEKDAMFKRFGFKPDQHYKRD